VETGNLPLVLMADDDEDDCMLARDAFNVSGIPGLIDFVGDGMELLSYLSSSPTIPSVILLDLNMPRKNGHQTLKELKSAPSFQDIPVIVLTTSHEEDDMSYCEKEGALSFITKPASFNAWIDIMRSLTDVWPNAK
jgi:CheY-like chemotaxis protein